MRIRGEHTLSEEDILKALETERQNGGAAFVERLAKAEEGDGKGEHEPSGAKGKVSMRFKGRYGDYEVDVEAHGKEVWVAKVHWDIIELYAKNALDALPGTATEELRAELGRLAKECDKPDDRMALSRRLAMALREACEAGLEGEWGRPVPDEYVSFYASAHMEAANRETARRGGRVTGDAVVLGMMSVAWDEVDSTRRSSPQEKALVALRRMGVRTNCVDGEEGERLYRRMIDDLEGFGEGIGDGS